MQYESMGGAERANGFGLARFRARCRGQYFFAVTFEGHALPVYEFRRRKCVIGAQLGAALEYADDGNGLPKLIREKWSEIVEGRDFDILTGYKLKEFKQILGVTPSEGVTFAPHLMVVYETGVDLVLIKTEKPVGVRLRRLLADKVMPALRKGEPIGGLALTREDMAALFRAEVAPLLAKVDAIESAMNEGRALAG